MLTPRFKIEQDDKFVIVSIYAPFTHVAETEVFMDETDFRFFSKPYFLRLHFPCEIIENDDASAAFDAENLSYVVKCPKVNPGQFFPNLDMITELCKPKGKANAISTIEVLDYDSGEVEEEDEWYFDQDVNVPIGDEEGEDNFGIGFGLKHKNVFNKLLDECQEVLDIKNPDSKDSDTRRKESVEKEDDDFDSDHYLSDLFEPDDILLELLQNPQSRSFKDCDAEDTVKLTEYTKKDTKLPSELKLSAAFTLVDVLFAYCYELRVNFGENTSESGWTIAKLCGSLVCSQVFKSLSSAIVSSSRRSLIYPLYRHFDLTTQVWNDVTTLLKSGRSSIIKALLSISGIFNESEGRYLFNQLYLDQYIAWVQKIKPDKLIKLSNEIDTKIKSLTKSDLKLDLVELEQAAEIVLKESEEEALIEGMNKVEIRARNAAESDSDDDISSSESSSSSSDSESSSETEDASKNIGNHENDE